MLPGYTMLPNISLREDYNKKSVMNKVNNICGRKTRRVLRPRLYPAERGRGLPYRAEGAERKILL